MLLFFDFFNACSAYLRRMLECSVVVLSIPLCAWRLLSKRLLLESLIPIVGLPVRLGFILWARLIILALLLWAGVRHVALVFAEETSSFCSKAILVCFSVGSSNLCAFRSLMDSSDLGEDWLVHVHWNWDIIWVASICRV